MHIKTGLMYIYEFRHSKGKDRVEWLRFDTWVWGALGQFPYKVARERDLRRFNRRALHMNVNGENRDPTEPTFVQMEFE